MTVAEGLRRFRRERKLTQRELAAELGMFQQEIQRYESGRVQPLIGFLIKLADTYNVSIDYLVGRSEQSA